MHKAQRCDLPTFGPVDSVKLLSPLVNPPDGKLGNLISVHCTQSLLNRLNSNYKCAPNNAIYDTKVHVVLKRPQIFDKLCHFFFDGYDFDKKEAKNQTQYKHFESL